MNSFTEAAVTVASLIIGVAALSVIVSKNSNSSGVIQSLASGFSNSLGTAMSPVTGASVSINTGYPSYSPNSSFGLPTTNAGSPNITG